MISPADLSFETAGFSEQGPRSDNQDAYSIDGFADLGMVALADGMGGEKSGRIAADRALESLSERSPIRTVDAARRAVRDADLAVRKMAEDSPSEHGGMGCALGLLSLTDGRDGAGWVAAHVGDVRILSRSPDGVLRLETRDHTPAFARWEAGEISLDEIPDSSGANRLQRAVGRGGEADVVWMPAAPGWTWLLISDGVYKAMRLDELSAAMGAASAGEVCSIIRAKVADRGPDDNYTAVVVRAAGGNISHTPIDPEITQPMIDSPPPARPQSKGSALALPLALLALLLGGYAAWAASTDGPEAAPMSEVEALREEVDSLRALVAPQVDPFGPTAPTTPTTDTISIPDTAAAP